MTIQQSKIDYKSLKTEFESDYDTDELDLGLPSNLSLSTCTWEDVLLVFNLFQNGQLKNGELLAKEGLRIHLTKITNPISENNIQILRKMLERVMKTPITVYWSANYIDFVPI